MNFYFFNCKHFHQFFGRQHLYDDINRLFTWNFLHRLHGNSINIVSFPPKIRLGEGSCFSNLDKERGHEKLP